MTMQYQRYDICDKACQVVNRKHDMRRTGGGGLDSQLAAAGPNAKRRNPDPSIFADDQAMGWTRPAVPSLQPAKIIFFWHEYATPKYLCHTCRASEMELPVCGLELEPFEMCQRSRSKGTRLTEYCIWRKRGTGIGITKRPGTP